MPLRDDLLTPITGENPSGVDLRHELYGEIREARRQDDDLPQGDWQTDRKVADFVLVSKLTQENLSTRTKDLQLAAWLTESLVHLEGFAGLHLGLQACTGLITNFWDTLYPVIEDGDTEVRSALLEWLAGSLEVPLKNTRLTTAGFDFMKFQESRVVGYEEQAQSDKERTTRDKQIAEGKLSAEDFDKAFVATPKVFYVQSEKDLDSCLSDVRDLDRVCTEKLQSDAPSFNRLKVTLEEIRHTVHALLQKKRETEPDPVDTTEASAAETGADASGSSATGATAAASVIPTIVIQLADSESPARKDAIARIALAAAQLRKQDPLSPAPYLLMRGLRWGELRASPGLADARLLEAPSTELRQHVKRLALASRWNDLLETAENAMSLPCSRAWLDLQRLVVVACGALGPEYEPIASAIRSELRSLLHDIPELLHANLLDDTPAANAETQAWLRELLEAPAPSPAPAEPAEEGATTPDAPPAPSWIGRAVDPFALAQDALRAGNPQKAVQIMHAEIARQKSGRGRFQRKLQLIQLCVEAGNDAIAQPLLDDVAAAVENHKLDDWEDPEMVAAALTTIMKLSRKVQDSSSETQQMFERICRLDPARALRTG